MSSSLSNSGMTSMDEKEVWRRPADQAVHAVLTLKIAVGVLALDHDGRALEACFFAVQPVCQLDLEIVALCPAGDHTVQHQRPVLSLCSARAWVEGDDGVVAVVLARQQYLNALGFLFLNNSVQLGLNLAYRALVVFLDGHFSQRDCILKAGAESVVALDLVLSLLDGLEHLGGILLVGPEICVQSLLFQLYNLFSQLVDTERRAKIRQILTQTDKFIFCIFKCDNQM